MTKSNRTRKQIKNYYRVREALYQHFPKASIVDYPYNYAVYLDAQYFFKNEGQVVLIYYAQDRLLYPHHLDYVQSLPYYDYTGIACFNEENKVINSYNDYLTNFNPTQNDIDYLCGFISQEITRMKEYIKLNKIKDDF